MHCRCIGELSKKNEERAKEVLRACGIPFFMDILSTHDMKTVNASSYIIQVILDALSHSEIMKVVKEKKKKPREMTSDDRKWCMREEQRRNDIIKANSKELDSIMNVLLYNVTSRTITGEIFYFKWR